MKIPIERIYSEIESTWQTNKKPVWKSFSCDVCNKTIQKAYHVWTKRKEKFMEFHFCKSCAAKIL